MSFARSSVAAAVLSLFLFAGCGGNASDPNEPVQPGETTEPTEAEQHDMTPAPAVDNQPGPNAAPSEAATTPDEPMFADDSSVPAQPEEGFTPLTLDDFKVFSEKPEEAGSTWEKTDNGIRTTGTPRGYIFSKQAYDNFTIKYDYRFAQPPEDADEEALGLHNTGLLAYITGEHKRWPASLEVQGRFSDMANIKPNGGAADVMIDENDQARQEARKPVGEWNSIEVTSRDGALTAKINGTLVCESQPGELTLGAIGFQAENYPVEFRNLRIHVGE